MLTYGGVKYSESGKYNSRKSDIAIIGCPSDLGATTATGQSSGPAHIRFHSEQLTEKHVDAGNIVAPNRNNKTYLDEVAWHVSSVAQNTECVVVLGGDDSINYGVVSGLLDKHESIGVIHYDAHNDQYGYGEDIDHSNWVQYVKEFDVRVRQWGCRAKSPSPSLNENILDLPLLIAIDMDVFDPAYAPGVACPHPYGSTPKEVLDDIFSIASNNSIVGISVTEVVADRDINNHTALLAHHTIAKIIDWKLSW